MYQDHKSEHQLGLPHQFSLKIEHEETTDEDVEENHGVRAESVNARAEDYEHANAVYEGRAQAQDRADERSSLAHLRD